MTREEIIGYAEAKKAMLQERMDGPESMYGGYAIYSPELEFVSASIAALREQEERRWIPVTERLPDEHKSLFADYRGTSKWLNGMFMTLSDTVIVCVEYDDGTTRVKPAYCREGVWKIDNSFYPGKVTHWMPLPEPPKETTNGKS